MFYPIKSYEGKHSTGTVKLLEEFDSDLNNRHVVIVEDIVKQVKL